jgi:MFS family permease
VTKDNPLASRDFVSWWLGNFVSLIGTQMTWVAVPYQVYVLTGNSFALGSIGLARGLPLIVMALLGGVIADVIDRRRLLIATQSIYLCLSALLAYAAYRGFTSVPLLYGVSVAGGALLALDLPARQALMPNLVPKEAFPHAVSYNAFSFQFAAVLGPALGGYVLWLAGPSKEALAQLAPEAARLAQLRAASWVYAVDATTFLAVILALVTLRWRRDKDAPVLRASLATALEGPRFVWSQPILWLTMTLDFLATFFAGAMLLMPVFAVEVFHGTPETLGLLLAAPAAGAALAALVTTRLPPIRAQGAAVLLGVAAYGITTAVFGATASFPLALFMLALSGAADSVSMVVRNTLRQELTPDAMRGRMVAFNMIFFVGGPLLGEFEAGAVAALFGKPDGARLSVITGGVACVVCAILYVLLAPRLWRYVREEPVLVEVKNA